MADEHKDLIGATPDSAEGFALRTLYGLLAILVAGIALAPWLDSCLAAALAIPVGLAFVCYCGPFRRLVIQFLIAYLIFVLVGFICFVLPAWDAAQEATRRMQCSNNLKQIGVALHNYDDTYGSFPPAYITDDEGHPIHSWRVLILPFLDQQPLYDRYRFDEPWDGPNNIKLVEEMPSVFQCPSNQSAAKTNMNYVAVIGPQTAWPGDTPVRRSDIVDGTSNTWLVVEVADSGIEWSEPRDLHVLQIAPKINASAGQGISSKHPGGAQVLCADGSVHFVFDASSGRSAFDFKAVHDALTINGGEPVDGDW